MKIWSCSALCSILWPSLGIQYTAYTINRGQHACTLKKNKLKVHWVLSNVLFHGLRSCEELDQSIGDYNKTGFMDVSVRTGDWEFTKHS